MREKAFQLGFFAVLVFASPCALLASTHTAKPAARSTAHASRPAAKTSSHSAASAQSARALLVKAAKTTAHGHEAAPAATVPTRRGSDQRTATTLRTKAQSREELQGAKHAPQRLTKAQQRAQAAEDAREAAAARRGGKVELASNPHPLRWESSSRAEATQAANRPTRFAAPAHPVATQPMASLNVPAQPLADADPIRPAPLPPVNVHHDRKQHFSAGDSSSEADDAAAQTPATDLPVSHPQPQSAPAVTNRLQTGVAHPDEMDEQGPMSPAVRSGSTPPQPALVLPAPAPLAQQVRPAPGIGRAATTFSSAQHAAIGTPLVMAAAAPAPVSLSSNQALPEPVAQVEPSAAVRAKLPTIEDEVVDTPLVPSLFNRQGQLMMPPALKGSHEILVHQNVEADREGLARVRDDNDLQRMRAQRLLVPLPDETGIDVDERLPANRRYARPWTVKFLTDLARAHYQRFHSDLIITSAVRTVEVQQRLLRVNGNAAPAEGETASPHLTGQAVDLGKKPLSQTEIAWMRAYLLPLVQAGKIDVEEEFQQACFHISVYRGYAPSAGAEAHRIPASSLATALPIK